ncbi:ABC transporter substrate-binding protein [Acholeplasma vituli]|uniref:ABC transporter substrate-binding protein n=1 Tax=Paracholeplasma vituli TaxID=69473 RepID=A0ABT2PT67_9MOLU|nr:ABC transporter substrate-binding protein [Paracholeplasma vituli]MCU0104141.1 ABC transporter substrate-binding protein [Paracholeplasma vituli]
MKKVLTLVALILSLVIVSACNGNGGVGEVKTIVIDGGGDIGNFNTTPLMTPSEANPFPYNTLEVLAREWEKLNPKYKIEINKTSSNGDRAILVPQLNNKTAPDITYQNGTVVNMDLGKDYYVVLNEYLNKPNKYVSGNKAWKDLYIPEELAQNMASDGNYYTITLEKVPVGIMYNKAILAEAGITKVPETYAEFLQALSDIKSKTNKEAYTTTYTWYDIVLESTMFSDILPLADVLTVNGKVDTEEFVRAFEKGIWNPTVNAIGSGASLVDNRYYEYIKVTKMKTEFYPQNWQSYDAHTNFVNGNLAMVEVTGREIRKLSINKNINFEWGVMPYPDLTTATTQHAYSPSIRGVAGLATPWFITNSAVEKGTVEGAVDFLMFLTAPQNNNRLIGDLKGGIPLNPDSETAIAPYLQDLLEIYTQDKATVNTGSRVYWGSVNSWAMLGYAYNTAFIKSLQDIDNKVKTTEEVARSLAQTIRNTIQALKIENEYDESKW